MVLGSGQFSMLCLYGLGAYSCKLERFVCRQTSCAGELPVGFCPRSVGSRVLLGCQYSKDADRRRSIRLY